MPNILLVAAILPIFALCFFIYSKDKTGEPKGLLTLIFFLGLLTVIPVIVCELLFDYVFPMKNASGFFQTFIYVCFGVALFEELFKWLVTKLVGYNNKEFDEVFDVIVYSVFASLGFACFENVMYVFSNGFLNAIFRALLAVPGHTCFAISMGYFFSKAKVGQINGNKKIYHKNLLLSFVAPIFLHTMYDTLLFVIDENSSLLQFIPFLIFYLAMVVVCFLTVDKIAKVQQNLTTNIENGNIAVSNKGYIYYNAPTVPVTEPVSAPVVPQTVPVQSTVVESTEPIEILDDGPGVFPDKPVEIPTTPTTVTPSTTQVIENVEMPHVCLICGRVIHNENFCPSCGFKLK